MKLHRFFGDFDLAKPSVRLDDREVLDQLRNVLRLSAGDKIILADGKGNEAVSEIKTISQKFAEIAPLELSKNLNEPERKVVLFCSILKRENFELVVQKATELGVSKIVPVISKRTVKLNINPERLRKIIKEAAEQSGRGVLPEISEPLGFDDAFASAPNENIFYDLGGGQLLKSSSSEVGIWIGPEGGWDEEESARAREKGFNVASLGNLTLRAETAAIVAVYRSVNG